MIVTKNWLNEWIDLSDVNIADLEKTFNAIGLEVDRSVTYTIPKKIIVGEVLECEKHPDADKLNVCKVDIGSSIRQIVCGAANVRAGIKVAVAVLGAKMPSGMDIKPVKLRGVDSEGMICSSSEIGLPDLEKGIMVLDESIGTLKLGRELSEYPSLNDSLIELELTANRGDCLSIRGVARDLSASYNRPIRDCKESEEEDRNMGIGRVLQLKSDESLDLSLRYRAIDFKSVELPLVVRLRLAMIEEKKSSELEDLLFYATYNTGVVLHAYNCSTFNVNADEKAVATIKTDEKNFPSVFGAKKASVVGVKQMKESKAEEEGLLFLEASYIAPDIISKKNHENRTEVGDIFYRTSRGSEPDLNLGLRYFLHLLESHSISKIYGGSLELHSPVDETIISISLSEINAMIGMDIEKKVVTQILKGLGFDLRQSQSDNFNISVPQYRHDISHKQDIVEEVVRLVGIDNIKSKAFVFSEKNRKSDDYSEYLRRKAFRHASADNGFYESVHFVFNERITLEKHGFTCIDQDKELLNPITNTFDTLRPTLLMGLLEAASRNVKFGRKQVKLFELGSVFSTQRDESLKLGFIQSGDLDSDTLLNAGKPASIGFEQFSQRISNVIGDFKLVAYESTHKLAHPYQCAQVIINGAVVGEMFKLHPDVANAFDLRDTMMCEIDFSALKSDLKVAKEYSKYQASFRDLSLVIHQDLKYSEIEKIIEAAKTQELIRFYPVDRYQDEAMGENVSLTLRFVLQSHSKTLEEEDITNAMDSILGACEEELGLSLR